MRFSRTGRWRGLAEALGLSVVGHQNAPVSSAIAAALGTRLREILPEADGWTVDVEGPVLTVRSGRGSSSTGMPGLTLMKPGSAESKLQHVFETEAEALTDWVAYAQQGNPPHSGFDPHVSVTTDAVHVWWGGPTEADAAVRLRPIPRSELGM